MESLPPPPPVPTPRRRVLFLKTSTKPLSLMGPSYTLLLETLHKKGLEVEERIWYPSLGSLTPKDLTTAYQSITFLACWDYNLHITEFHKFLDEVITPIQKSGIKVVNPVELIHWNSNKIYLKDLQNDLGVIIPDTMFVDTTGGGEVPGYQDVILDHAGAMGSHGVVIKPSVSASAKETHRIPDLNSKEYDPLKAQANWAQVYEYARSLSSSVRVMIQAFEPAIKNGEYSIIFLGGEYSHTILKRPMETDFRAIEEYGARIGELESSKVPEEGKEVGRRVIEYVKRRFGYGEDWKLGYLRLDGVVRDDGTFVVIEAEMLEPYVYLHVEGAKGGLERFCEVLGGLN
ncbi:hypothetical protein TWF192_008874 [Orbilia oligospora]|uniref:Uncharacterized protein n=2 Tax=Orbilia oligospora TaxID=2813651 RepID=A0A6G1M100_ORBOL|nr:hypothetical protein TWF191_006443 [Orbilia oligospora]KAF3241579.1 hypothetical protein TWF192_008874 [Orbilia oligospora]